MQHSRPRIPRRLLYARRERLLLLNLLNLLNLRSLPPEQPAARTSRPAGGEKSIRLAGSRPSVQHPVDVVSGDCNCAEQISECVRLYVAGLSATGYFSTDFDLQSMPIYKTLKTTDISPPT